MHYKHTAKPDRLSKSQQHVQIAQEGRVHGGRREGVGGPKVAPVKLEIIFDIFIFIFFHLFHFNFGVTNAIRDTKLRWANDYEILPEIINKINATK